MPIAALHKTTLIDYPGKVACTVFFTGCNFTCPYCHNPDLAAGRLPAGGGLAPEALLAFLEQRKGFFDGVVLSGGEPTLAPELAGICRAIKDLGLAVKLDTNGSRPAVLADLIGAGLVDYIAMDLKTLPDDYHPHLSPLPCGAALQAAIGLLTRCGLPHEFRTTCAPPFVDRRRLLAMGPLIRGAPLWALQALQTANLRDPDFFHAHPPAPARDEMAALQTVAAPFVQRCILR